MITVKSNNALRYHVYHMVTLFYAAQHITYLDELNPQKADLEVFLVEDRITIDFLGAIKILDYRERDLNIMRRAVFLLLREKTGKELPWGILIGIRPSKIVRELIEEGFSKEDITQKLQATYLTESPKIHLAYEVAMKEISLLKRIDKEGSCDLYVGMPFCPSRCVYCSFASNVYKGNKYKETYLSLLLEEMDMIREFIEEKGYIVNSLYFGGGTPTAISEEEFETVMKKLYEAFIQGRNLLEVTVEAGRVDSLTKEKLCTMKNYGVTRISINPQTMKDETLKIIGRNHTAKEVQKVFYEAREVGFDNINMDLILGLPGETLEDVERTLTSIKELAPESITVHGLAIKRASILYEEYLLEKKYLLQEQRDLNLMFEKTDAVARSLGMKPYYMYRQKNMVGNLENVGYAKEGYENLYNVVMIEEVKTIIAMGADGVTKKVEAGQIERFANFKGLNDYTERFQEMMEKKMRFLHT